MTGSYQEGALERYFNENPGTREILQEKFHALYQMAGEEILSTQDDEADCKFYYILDRACPKKDCRNSFVCRSINGVLFFELRYF